MLYKTFLKYSVLSLITSTIFAAIPTKKVIQIETLPQHLKSEIVQSISDDGEISTAELAQYFRDEFSQRFFYDWQTFQGRFDQYNNIYNAQQNHENRANDHLKKFTAKTQWKLPFNYQYGEPVNAYALRHLARQHKMKDIALQHFYKDKESQNIRYFVDQMNSLNNALESGDYEKIEDGNGVYEAFRSGYRVLNWLSIHNMFLNQSEYSDEDQLLTIATLLQHGAHLYDCNPRFRPGNHQTRGMSALAMLSILLRDFEGTDLWYERSMQILGEHLDKEINNDGFQFERSVHYHISDIENYFYVYQLVKRSDLSVDKVWEEKLRSLFETLGKIAYPDKSSPVLQDDTDNPWAEKNDISGAMTLGYLLFENPDFGYFAKSNVESKLYWFIHGDQLAKLKSIDKKIPEYGSLYFPDTKYYIMREGWQKNDKMMIISAGLDDKKPDHQHGDMLGVQAMAFGNVILPNYQVRYPLKDYEFFKNSMVKNVALVDDQLQGKEYKGNKGGSGFGKFKKLPNPSTILWETYDDFDIFIGSHDGFNGVDYTRQVIYVKDDFWIVKDNFSSGQTHEYKQVWQGHYSLENSPQLLRSSFSNSAGCDIYQMNSIDDAITDGRNGKEWTVLSKKDEKDFEFITIIFPFADYSDKIDEDSESLSLAGWNLEKLPISAQGENLKSISRNDSAFLFNVKTLKLNNNSYTFNTDCDLFIDVEKLIIINISNKNIKDKKSNKLLKPGEHWKI